MQIRNSGVLACTLVACGWLAPCALATDLKLITTFNIRPALDELKPAFEKTSEATIVFQSQGAAATRSLVEGGATGDIVIGSRSMLDELMSDGRLKPGSIADIAHSSVGVVVRQGASRPDISTDEKLRKVLLEATSIVYPDPSKGSLGGNYFSALIGQWGVASQINAKALLVAGGSPAAQAVADGKAQIGLNQIAEMSDVHGVVFLSPLPPSLTRKIVMSAALLKDSRQEALAGALIKFLSSPNAAAALKAHGMEP
jgi:molybdate transport system substrate-binding protein